MATRRSRSVCTSCGCPVHTSLSSLSPHPPSPLYLFSFISLYSYDEQQSRGWSHEYARSVSHWSTSEAARCPDHRGTLRRDWPRCCHIHIHTCSHAVCGQVNAGRALRAITHVECVYLAYYRVPLSDNTHRGTPTSQRDSIQWNLIRALAPRCIIDLLALVKWETTFLEGRCERDGHRSRPTLRSRWGVLL